RAGEEELVLPHDDEAERCVLGAMLIADAALPVALQALRADDFYRESHRRVYRALERLAARAVATDRVLVLAELRDRGELDGLRGFDDRGLPVQGVGFVACLLDGVPRTANISHYCERVAEK